MVKGNWIDVVGRLGVGESGNRRDQVEGDRKRNLGDMTITEGHWRGGALWKPSAVENPRIL